MLSPLGRRVQTAWRTDSDKERRSGFQAATDSVSTHTHGHHMQPWRIGTRFSDKCQVWYQGQQQLPLGAAIFQDDTGEMIPEITFQLCIHLRSKHVMDQQLTLPARTVTKFTVTKMFMVAQINKTTCTHNCKKKKIVKNRQTRRETELNDRVGAWNSNHNFGETRADLYEMVFRLMTVGILINRMELTRLHKSETSISNLFRVSR